jgi:hypothetical protein
MDLPLNRCRYCALACQPSIVLDQNQQLSNLLISAIFLTRIFHADRIVVRITRAHEISILWPPAQLSVPVTGGQVIVDHPHCLHERITNCGTDKGKSTPQQVFAQRV